MLVILTGGFDIGSLIQRLEVYVLFFFFLSKQKMMYYIMMFFLKLFYG